MKYQEMLITIRNAQAEYIYTERKKVDKFTGKRKTFEEIGRTLKMTRQQAHATLESYLQDIKKGD